MFHTVKRIIRWSGAYKRRLYWGFVLSFFASWMTAAPVMLAARALGDVLEAHWSGTALPAGLVWTTTAGIAVCILARFACTYGKNVLQESIGHEVGSAQRIRLGDVLKRVSLGYFSRNSVGDILAAATTELSTLELQSMKMIDAVVCSYIQLLAILLCLAFLSPVTALIGLMGAALSSLALYGISSRSRRTAPVSHRAVEDMSGAAIEYVRGLPIVKSFGQEGASAESFRRASRSLRDIRIRIEKGFVPCNCLHQLALKAASMGIVLVCVRQVAQGAISIPVFLMFILFSFSLFNSVENVNDASHVLGVVDSAMDKLEGLENAEFIDRDGGDIPLDAFDISFRDVSFGYDSRTVLHDVSFTLPEGTTTAIVGPSGSGKSTLCSLIARFYDVDGGAIRIGGHDVREFTCDSLLGHISMVFQNVYLFRESIRNNIAFGKPGATQEEIVAAARAARCHDFITALPEGYDTLVGEGGSSLSGGEKQRISIARAILKDAPIVLLDEATASIDPENEHLIQEAITRLTGTADRGPGKTIVIIAHRLATIEHADQILVIDGGTVAQQGTHGELLGQEGTYREYIRLREEAEGWRIA